MGGIWSILFGRTIFVNGLTYRVVRKVGEGGFSFVFLVRRSDDGSRLALKELLLQVAEQKDSVEKEISIHKAVSHRNVVQLVDSQVVWQTGEAKGKAFLLFPFYQRGTLLEEIEVNLKQGQRTDERRILTLFLSVCRGLGAMHASGLVHRDIKPGNLLLTDDGQELVLMDLGSAAEAEVTITNRQDALALQENCAQLCTAQFRAPELFEVPSECVITAKTDIWSLGCSMFALAFGHSPCDGSALAAVSGRISFPKKHCYSDEFCDLIRWVMQTDPSMRPDAAEVEQRILRMLENEQ